MKLEGLLKLVTETSIPSREVAMEVEIVDDMSIVGVEIIDKDERSIAIKTNA